MMQSFSLGNHWRRWLRGWQQVDWLLFALPTLLMVFASVQIASTQINLEQTAYGWNHLILGLLSLGIGLGVSSISLRASAGMAVGNLWGGECSPAGGDFYRHQRFGCSALDLPVWLSCPALRICQGGFNHYPGSDAECPQCLLLFGGVLRALAVAAVPWSLVFVQPDLGHLPRIWGDHHWHAVLGKR
jgi:rod shape determining protein RodA